MIRKTKGRIHDILEATDPGNRAGWAVNVFIMGLIVLNAGALVVESVKGLATEYTPYFNTLGAFSITVFTVEYVLRVWTSNVDERFRDPLFGRIRFCLTPMAFIDLMVILPFYLPVIFMDLNVLRVIRVFWILRLLRLGRYFRSMKTLENVLRAKKDELVMTFFAIILFLFFASCTVYFLEHEVQPESFSSIPETMWWGILTLTTIGYDDVYPVTPVGKLVGSMVIILGVGMFAIPTGILASGFVEEIQRRRARKGLEREGMVCPHCGGLIDLDEVQLK